MSTPTPATQLNPGPDARREMATWDPTWDPLLHHGARRETGPTTDIAPPAAAQGALEGRAWGGGRAWPAACSGADDKNPSSQAGPGKPASAAPGPP